jgi:hypothetical protein
MTADKNQEVPVAILLVATFFILIATWFFAQMSFDKTSNSALSIILSLLGAFFIVVGWGILNLRPWAYPVAIIISGISLLFSMFFLFLSPIYFFILLLFIPVIIILLKNKATYTKESTKQTQYIDYRGRMCPNCGRPIPFDANICPYCGKKFESYI